MLHKILDPPERGVVWLARKFWELKIVGSNPTALKRIHPYDVIIESCNTHIMSL